MASSKKPRRILHEYDDFSVEFRLNPSRNCYGSTILNTETQEVLETHPATPKNSPTAGNARQYITMWKERR